VVIVDHRQVAQLSLLHINHAAQHDLPETPRSTSDWSIYHWRQSDKATENDRYLTMAFLFELQPVSSLTSTQKLKQPKLHHEGWQSVLAI
jgi:hypothetical protein